MAVRVFETSDHEMVLVLRTIRVLLGVAIGFGAARIGMSDEELNELGALEIKLSEALGFEPWLSPDPGVQES